LNQFEEPSAKLSPELSAKVPFLLDLSQNIKQIEKELI